MINVSLFFRTFTNFAVFFLLFVFGSFWAYYCFKNKKNYCLVPVVICSALLFVAWGMLAGVDIDEIEHLHCSWMVYSGLVPFKDFWQHHAPIVWVMLAPVFAVLKPSASILSLSRIFCGLVFVLTVFTGWKLAQKVWQKEARLSMYLLIVFACGIMGQFLRIRPDLFATLFLLVFIYFCLEIPEKKIAPSFFAGAAFGLAAAFIFKQYLLFFLPFFIILKEKNGSPAAKIGAYLLGVCFGVLPLAFYLFDKGIVKEFIFWVISYNHKRLVYSVDFPLAVTAIGVGGAYLLFKRYRASGCNKAFVLLAAFCLSTLSSLTHTLFPFYSYNIGLWYMLCAATGSSQGLQSLVKRLPTFFQRSLAAGLFFSMILSPPVVDLTAYNKDVCFSANKKVISQLIKYGSGDTCLTILPHHPIFVLDASRLYAFWQLHLSSEYPELRGNMIRRGMSEVVRSKKPAVVLCILDKKDFLLELVAKALISRKDYDGLMLFFKAGYTMKPIGGNWYFIRNDKL